MAWVKQRITDNGTKRFVACYRDPDGRQRSAGTFSSRRAAERAGQREEVKVQDGSWHDHSRGEVTFTDYVATVWLPSRHIEASTLAAYQSYLNKHFYPFFGARQMGRILPSDVQRWVTTVTHPADGKGLSPRSVRKYHTMLHSVFKRAVRDRVIPFNPCEETELPKVVTKHARTLTPAEYERLVAAIPERHRLMVEVAIGTGLRWGELIALRPRHLDLDSTTGTGTGTATGTGIGRLTVAETIVEVPLRAAPNGERMIVKAYPKDNEPRTMGLDPDLIAQLTSWIADHHLGPDDLLFATREGTPISRNTFRTRIWAPAVQAAGIDFNVRIHDLRHAHASWLLAGGSDLKSVMDRMGHTQIQTTQRYLHALPEADQKNLNALNRTRRRTPRPNPTAE